MENKTAGKIYGAVIACMREIGAIDKDRKNAQQGYNFRGIDDVYNELHSIMAKNGIFSVSEIIAEKTEDRTTSKGNALIYRVLRIRYTFFAEDGSYIVSEVIGEGMDSGDKASNKAMAVAHKYALMQIFCIPTKDEKDPENQSHDLAPQKQRVETARQAVKEQPKAPSLMEATFDMNSTEHQQAAAAWLKTKNVDENYWSAICMRMEGKIFKELGMVAKEVMNGVTVAA